jgi:hypothetical protein
MNKAMQRQNSTTCGRRAGSLWLADLWMGTGDDGNQRSTSELPNPGTEGGEQQAMPMPDLADWFPPSLPGSPVEQPRQGDADHLRHTLHVRLPT